ncbi:MAG: 4Fe-4S dicluster domain-containing protein [Candidatus Krumholzibacteria bacterium]|nr:4Fe-4S dicluster domain-containing protein [Candidatus Krumholzibacteria bacterium]
MRRIDHRVAEQIRELGASDLGACYSCGTCSALCPLTDEKASFPRKMIRYAMLGLEDRILASPEPWLCYYCGECSETCPREADPGGLMMALRRFAIRRYLPGRIVDRFSAAVSSAVTWILLTIALILGVILLHDPDMDRSHVDFLSFMPLETIHAAGIAVVVFIGLAVAANVYAMVRAIGRPGARSDAAAPDIARSIKGALAEAALQRRFGECTDDAMRRLAHLGLTYGFAGMFLATLIVMGIDYEYLRVSRVIPLVTGSVSGAAAMVGTVYFIVQRIRHSRESAKHSRPSDWIFLTLIFLSIATGYVMLAFRFLGMPMAAYVSFSVHLVVVFELMLSFPFTKFAHIVYRPLALWLAGVK